jgi:hypothetical protein
MANWVYRTQVSRTKDGSLKFERQMRIGSAKLDQWKPVSRFMMLNWGCKSSKMPQWVSAFLECILDLTPEERKVYEAIMAQIDASLAELPRYLDTTKPMSDQLAIAPRIKVEAHEA